MSPSTPVLLSASEPEDEESVDDDATTDAGEEFSGDTVELAQEDSLFSRCAFLALRRASFLSSFWKVL